MAKVYRWTPDGIAPVEASFVGIMSTNVGGVSYALNPSVASITELRRSIYESPQRAIDAAEDLMGRMFEEREALELAMRELRVAIDTATEALAASEVKA